jgi:hypothetical protein
MYFDAFLAIFTTRPTLAFLSKKVDPTDHDLTVLPLFSKSYLEQTQCLFLSPPENTDDYFLHSESHLERTYVCVLRPPEADNSQLNGCASRFPKVNRYHDMAGSWFSKTLE